MKHVVIALAFTSLASCLGTDGDSLSSSYQDIGVKPGHCPDPGDCSVANGGGIYVEEGGHIGVVSHGADFMIAKLVNRIDPDTGPYVGWEGRAQLLPAGYGPQQGRILFAYYAAGGGVALQFNVTRVEETSTIPAFTLVSATDPAHPITVTGAELYNLRLVITTPLAYALFTATLYFSAPNKPNPEYTTTYGNTGRVYKYAIYWYEGSDPVDHDPPVSFCQRAPVGSAAPAPDFAVFQQDIDVDPLTAQTLFGQRNTVTVSCALGAIATARTWGYPYRDTTRKGEVMFESVMHMKRASYCGDITSYTQGGTQIIIYDGVLHADPVVMAATAEAVWGLWPDGQVRALCVNKSRERRPGLRYPPTDEGALFTGDCFPDDGSPAFKIPACKASGYPTATISDAPASP